MNKFQIFYNALGIISCIILSIFEYDYYIRAIPIFFIVAINIIYSEEEDN